MSEHTKEPWKSDKYPKKGGGYGFQIWNGGSSSIANLSPGTTTDRTEETAEANTRRIVACVNACEGIPTVVLEMDSAEFIKHLKERYEFQQQRDAAWAELRRIRVAIGANMEESTADEAERVKQQRDELKALWFADADPEETKYAEEYAIAKVGAGGTAEAQP